MDPGKGQYPGLWFICKYCQLVFRDKLELLCHHVTEHPEYRDELNGQTRNIFVNARDATVYTDPRANVENKRQGSIIVQATHQQANTGWNQTMVAQAQNHVDNHEYVSPPEAVQYYVVVPSQTQSSGTNVMTTAASVNPIINVPAAPTTNAHLSHSANSLASSHHAQATVTSHWNNSAASSRRVESRNDWNSPSKARHEPSQAQSTFTELRKPEDYYCWKCKVRFANSAAYIAHSHSCFAPAAAPSHSTSYEQPENSEEDLHEMQPPPKFGRRSRDREDEDPDYQPPSPEVKRKKPNRRINEERATASSNKGRRGKSTPTPSYPADKNFSVVPSTASGSVVPSTPDSKDQSNGSSGSGSTAKGSPRHQNHPCPHCGLKFNTNDRLTSHLVQCKSKKNPYETYQYKCIKCSESFDIYLQYKNHIGTHTGIFRYS